MIQHTYDVNLINQVLKQADIDIQVKSIPNSTKTFWLDGVETAYTLAVSVNFIVLLHTVLSNNFDPNNDDQLKNFENLFGDSFLQMNIPRFHFFPAVNTTALGPATWVLILMAAVVGTCWIELIKWFRAGQVARSVESLQTKQASEE